MKKIKENGAEAVTIMIVLIFLSLLVSFLTTSGLFWLLIYVLHAFGLFLSVKFTWLLAFAFWLVVGLITWLIKG